MLPGDQHPETANDGETLLCTQRLVTAVQFESNTDRRALPRQRVMLLRSDEKFFGFGRAGSVDFHSVSFCFS